jgi:hypothetical protein
LETFVLGSPVDLKYLAAYVADRKRGGWCRRRAPSRPGGSGRFKSPTRSAAGEPMAFEKGNIDKADF